MEPTVKAGQVITVRAVGRDYSPRRGDIVLFHFSDGERTEQYLKRVIAVGAETIICCDSTGKVTINGTPLAEPYVANDSPLDSRRFGPVAVPTGTVFVMGDNRAQSMTPGVTGRYR